MQQLAGLARAGADSPHRAASRPLCWAHQVAGRFGDGQLYVNLRGLDPSGVPMAAAGAVRGLLDALSVPPDRIPIQPEAQAGLYRSLLADRRMLIVLDNARAEALGHAVQAASLFRSIGEKTGETDLLNAVGWYHALLGDYEQAPAGEIVSSETC